MGVPLKNKNGANIANAFQSISNSSKRKPNTVWVEQGSEFCNNVFKKLLKENLLLLKDLSEL